MSNQELLRQKDTKIILQGFLELINVLKVKANLTAYEQWEFDNQLEGLKRLLEEL